MSNTLFNYFNRTPNQPSKAKPKIEKKSPLKEKKEAKNELPGECEFTEGDIVWAKLEGYPWWPSMVTKDPKHNKFYSPKKNKQPEIHVQFFDDPPSRAWIKERFVKKYTGSNDKDFLRGGQFYSSDPKVKKGAEQADEVNKKSKEDRLKLVMPVEEEDEAWDEKLDDEDLVKGIDFGDDIFDAEIDSGNSSKENIEQIKEETPVKSSSSKRTSTRPKPKRRKIIVSDNENDDSEDEFKPPGGGSESSDDDASSGVDEDDVSDGSASEPETPVKGKKRKMASKPVAAKTPSSLSKPRPQLTPSVSIGTKNKLASFAADESVSGPSQDADGRTFLHNGLKFIKPEHIRDGARRKADDPDYDPRTLYLPDDFLSKQTPGMRQWWQLKSKHFDTVLFFKMGKFYELFHMDADVAVKELGVIYMKGDHAHAGFPEIGYGRYAETLIQKGYKVARIEQTETPDMMTERCKNMGRSVTKFDKVVKREVCSIQTKATKRYSFIDGTSADTGTAYLLALCEKPAGESGGRATYGVCFVDTTVAKFHVGQFEDDRHCSRLRTMMSQYPPEQVLYERGKISDKIQTIFNSGLSTALKERLNTGSEFWDSSKTLKFLGESQYFVDQEDKEGEVQWPEALKDMMADGDTLCHTAGEDYDMGISALGAVIYYLNKCYMDEELISMRKFERYVPLDATHVPERDTTNTEVPLFVKGRQHMVLDGVTMANLDILCNSTTGGLEGSLLERLDMCHTPFGRRLFKQWLCSPLCNPKHMNERLDAVEDLMENQDVVAEATELLKKMPDLERLLSKVHTLGLANRSKNHPDARAVFFEDVTYSKRKIEDFINALAGFKTALKIAGLFTSRISSFKSCLLKQTLCTKEGQFPDLTEPLEFFDNAFDHQKAKKEGTVKPTKGVHPEFDQAAADIKSIIADLDSYLDKQKNRLECRTISYFGSGKNRYQMEIPEKVAEKVPDSYEVTSQRKGFKRYKTREIENHLSDLIDAEERKEAAVKDTLRKIFHSFDKSHQVWENAVQCLSVLDVMICLSQYSRCGDGVMCRPQFVTPDGNTQPYLEIRDGRHPCIDKTFSGSDFIPNDTVIGIADDNDPESSNEGSSKIVLVTGPNMGGKSTLMRQVGLITMLAQLGCYVPAESCKLTPVDRIFTRLGAMDRIMAGESTFFVELSETSAILQHATPHSLVLMDELGRGTATYDGTAIACAVVNELSKTINCRTLFSTHYHSLVEEFSQDPNIRTGHMACMVENENDEDPSQETITFLYKFTRGECPKSYGFNAARLADIPMEIINIAREKAKHFEDTFENSRCFRSLFQAAKPTVEQLKRLQNRIRVN